MATDSAAALKHLANLKQGDIPMTGDVIANAPKIKNRYLRKLVNRMKARKVSQEGIIKALLIIDQMVEEGKTPEAVFESLKQ